MTKHILIVGAGMTGLSAAWKLLHTQTDVQVTVLERDSVPGGLAKSIPWHGFYLDLGPHRFHTEIPEIKAFIKSFCEERMVRVPRFSRMFINGRYIPYPISPLKTMQALGPAKTLAFTASALGVLLKGGPKQARSYEEYVVGYYGGSLYRNIFKPLAEKVWGIPPSRIAAETARVRLRGDSIWHALKDSLLSGEETYVAEFLYPQHGMGEIAEKFAAEVENRGGRILYQHQVTSIQIEEGRVQSVTVEHPEGTKQIDCDLFISTIPLPSLVSRINPLPPSEVIQAAHSLHFRALVLLYLLYDKEYPIRDTWLYYPEEHVPFSRISVPGNFLPSRHRQGKTCFCVEFTCEVGDGIWQAAAPELAARAERVLWGSGLVDRPAQDSLSVRIKDGYPVYHIEYEQSLNQVLDYLRGLQNCLTVGRQGLFRHNNIDQAIQMGLQVAETISHKNDPIHTWYAGVDRFKDYRIVD